LFALKDKFNNTVYDEGGAMWTLPALALSARGLDYFQTNGQTPQGLHLMNSVMPTNEPFRSFGAFRRVILNWIPKSTNESFSKKFLDASSFQTKWWQESVIARDAGRSLLRIHGTGRRNNNRNSAFYPHKPTAGCISTRELAYDGVTYRDQRIILDEIMKALDLDPIYKNEELIKGVLHVIEIDDQKSKVTIKDLQALGLR
jgi:hypothetical protein